MIPVSEPWFTPEDAARVAACVSSGWVSSTGPAVKQFEAAWAQYCGRRFGIAMSSGTTALQASVAALNLAPGDEVIIPAFTIIPCALAVIYNGAVPVLVDSDPKTWCMDVGAIESKITPRTRAIMPVHIYGHPVDMEPLLAIAATHNLAVIEDAAEAHGAKYRMKNGDCARCGSFGLVSCFSFYANKLIATGEGGMSLTDDSDLAARLASLRDLCFIPGERFRHEETGFNFRLTNMQAALGLGQIERTEELLRRKRAMAAVYREELSGLPLQLATEQSWASSSFWMFGIVLDESVPFDAAEMARRSRCCDIETRPFFLGMHEQPALLKRGLFTGERYPIAERLARRGLYLPSGLGSSEGDFRRVARAVRGVLERA
jgi:perosamine synthetase